MENKENVVVEEVTVETQESKAEAIIAKAKAGLKRHGKKIAIGAVIALGVVGAVAVAIGKAVADSKTNNLDDTDADMYVDDYSGNELE